MDKEKIKEIINSDADMKCQYFSGGHSCFIGGLWLAAGFARQELMGLRNKLNITAGELNTQKLKLENHYGFGPEDLNKGQYINDDHDQKTARRKALCEWIDSL